MTPIPRNAILALAVLAPLAASGQAQESNPAEVDDTIDEITVLGARSLAMMRAEVIEAEDVVYDLFNELNNDDGYDIICKKETRIGSQIPQRICLARMYREQVAEETLDEEGGPIVIGNMTRSSRHQQILLEKMRALAGRHPELLDALKERYRLEKQYEQERDKRYGD